MNRNLIVTMVVTSFLIAACSGFKAADPFELSEPSTAVAYTPYTFTQANVYIQQYCLNCHMTGSAQGSFESYADLMADKDSQGNLYVIPGNPSGSELCTIAQQDPALIAETLPPDVAPAICGWIFAGAPNN